jgi:threonine synthase
VADAFFGEDVPADTLKQIVYDTLSFDAPCVKVKENIYSLELFHGPTLAFKDVGGRFMARLLGYFIQKEGQKQVNVLVATSGDTGSAVANGFLGVEGIHVYVLYPKGKVSEIQEKQFTTLGQNITALEVDGTFDDCQALVKNAFMDAELNAHMKLTSANSINVARFLPQAFYYFYAYAQLKKAGKADNLVVCVPSGNFGNITAGLFGKHMGLPVKRFIASNNANDIFYQYLQTAQYNPRSEYYRSRGGWHLRRLSGAGEECVHGCRAQCAHEAHLGQLHQRGSLLASSILLFLCVCPVEEGGQGR